MARIRKELGLLHVFCIASGAMISSGLFVLPGIAYKEAGAAAVVSYVIAGLLAMVGMLSQAELVSAMPKAGGDYFYVTRSMGPALGTVDGLCTWLSLCLKSAFALVGVAAFAAPMLGIDAVESWQSALFIGMPLCLFFVGVNLLGVKEAGRVQIVLVVGLMGLLGLFVITGLPKVKVAHFEHFMPEGGATAVFFAAGFVFISFGGLLKVASVAEEVKNPARTVPLGMILSLLVATSMYVLVVFVTVGVLKPEVLGKPSYTPISDAAETFLGRTGYWVLGVAAILAFISTANAGIMAASRYPLAASRDKLFPDFLTQVNRRFGTPHNAILVTGAIMVSALFFKLKILVEIASCVLILTFIFSCLAVIMMRESRVQNYRPRFRSPLYPWLQIAGVVGYGFLIWNIGRDAMLATLLPIVGGLFLYWFYGRIRSNREYALLHLIERITATELTTGLLQTELKEIIRERDDILKDRFDHVIEDCMVLDLTGPITLDAFLRAAAKPLSQRLGVPEEEMHRKLLAREQESTTTITPTLAIPHIICEGPQCFEILMARCRGGIHFSDAAPKVDAVFVLVGSMDERNFHLRALAAIAQIVQDPHFEKNWMHARTLEELRDIILLARRARERALGTEDLGE